MKSTKIKELLTVASLLLITCIQVASCIESACIRQNLTAYSSYNTLSSNDITRSQTGSECYEWHISAPAPQQVFLHVSRLYVSAQSPCTTSSTSYVAIYDGPSSISPEVAVLCGYYYTGTYSSISSELTVVYRSSDQSRDYFSFSYNFADVTTQLSTYNSKTEAYTSPLPHKTLIIVSIVMSMVGLISSVVCGAFVNHAIAQHRQSRAATSASMSSDMALNRDRSNSSLPTFSSPATFNNWRPSKWQLENQEVAPGTSSDVKLQLEGISSLSTASPVTTSVTWDTCTATPPPLYPAHTVNLYSELETDRPAGGEETSTYAAHTYTVAIDDVMLQETPTHSAYEHTLLYDEIKAQEIPTHEAYTNIVAIDDTEA